MMMYQNVLRIVTLITEAGVDYDHEKQFKGEQTPVFFARCLHLEKASLNYYVDNAQHPKGRRGAH